jgi:hypothetical protein
MVNPPAILCVSRIRRPRCDAGKDRARGQRATHRSHEPASLSAATIGRGQGSRRRTSAFQGAERHQSSIAIALIRTICLID